ncbi:MAG: 1-acyl-sn-glycerol-3-phosphate acyltransferase [Bacteroidota bacterium]
MSKFDKIRPFYDHEVRHTLLEWKQHPMMKVLFRFTFPNKSQEEIEAILSGCNSIKDFQLNVIYHSVQKILAKSTEEFTTSGFDKLHPDTSYLFFSNHRDIILDTSLLNYALVRKNLIMTASAIGDNLVQKPFLLVLSKLNRNFLIHRGRSPKETLISAKLVSEYIQKLLVQENRSVWIAQREGRTKDGNDRTQQGLLKMLTLTNGAKRSIHHFKALKIVPVSISYELDPTDILKMPELMAKHYHTAYTKANNEDFNTIIKGAIGQKKRIHIAVGDVLSQEIDNITAKYPLNQQFQILADKIDDQIHKNYKLWPSNYVAYDILYKTHRFKANYSDEEKRQFQRRIRKRVRENDNIATENFLAMYANPVVNKFRDNV